MVKGAASKLARKLRKRRVKKKSKQLQRKRKVQRVKKKAKEKTQPVRDLKREVAKQPEVQGAVSAGRRVSDFASSKGDDTGSGGMDASLKDAVLGSDGGGTGGGFDVAADSDLDLVDDSGSGSAESVDVAADEGLDVLDDNGGGFDLTDEFEEF